MRDDAAVSAELCSVGIPEPAPLIGELTTLLRFSGGMFLTNKIPRIHSEPVAEGAAERLSELLGHYGIDAPVVTGFRPRVEIHPNDVTALALRLGLLIRPDLPVLGLPPRLIADGARKPAVAAAALRGAALGTGQMVRNSYGGIKLVINCPGLPAAVALRGMIRHVGATANVREYEFGRYALTITQRGGLRTALLAMGATRYGSRLDPAEAKRTSLKGLNAGNKNRVLLAAAASCETARAALDLLGDDMPDDLAHVARARLAHPEESLTQLGERCGVNKNVVTARMRKLQKIADSGAQKERRPA
jgi:DNA-binding protein WhiA